MDGANLLPSRWLAESLLPSQGTLEEKLRDVEAAVASLSVVGPLPHVSLAERDGSRVKVGELVSNRSVKLVRTRALPSSAQQDVGTIPVLTPAVLSGYTAGQKYADSWAETNQQLTKAGDVAVWMAGEAIRVRVLADGGAVPSTQVQIIRVIDGSYLPEYLAVCLASGYNSRFLRGTTVQRPNLRDFEVPVVTLEEQKSIEEYVARIDGIRDQIRRASNLAEELRGLVVDAVGEGALRVE
nr:restriction endonuclease subunit S [Arthrobacter yangruifuii]